MSSNHKSVNPLISNQISNNINLFSSIPSCSEAQLELLTDILIQFSPFKSISSSSTNIRHYIRNLLFDLDYKIYPQGTALYHEGSLSNKTFFVLKGMIHNYIPRSSQDLVTKENPESTGVLIGEQKFVSLKKMSFMNAASPKVLTKLVDEINKRKSTILAQPSKFKRESVASTSIVPIQQEHSLMRRVTRSHNTFRNSLLYTEKPLIEQPNELKQFQKITEILLSRPNILETDSNTAKSQNPGSKKDNKSDIFEDIEDIQILDELKKLLDSSLTESTAKVLRNFPEKTHKYFGGGKCLFKFFDEFGSGECLGNTKTSASDSEITNHSAICIDETTVLICDYDNFIKCFKDMMLEKDHKVNLFLSSLAGVAETVEINYFMHHFTKRSYGINDTIFHEGSRADGMYLIYKGEVQLHKDTTDLTEHSPERDNSPQRRREGLVQKKKALLQMVTLGPKQFFGEEVLNNESTRKLAAVATSSHTEMYFIKQETLNALKGTCKLIIQFLKTQYNNKTFARNERLQMIAITNDKVESEGDLPLHRYKSSRNLERYIQPKSYRAGSFYPVERLGDALAYELADTEERRNRIEKIIRLNEQGSFREGKEMPRIRKKHVSGFNPNESQIENSNNKSIGSQKHTKASDCSSIKILKEFFRETLAKNKNQRAIHTPADEKLRIRIKSIDQRHDDSELRNTSQIATDRSPSMLQKGAFAPNESLLGEYKKYLKDEIVSQELERCKIPKKQSSFAKMIIRGQREKLQNGKFEGNPTLQIHRNNSMPYLIDRNVGPYEKDMSKENSVEIDEKKDISKKASGLTETEATMKRLILKSKDKSHDKERVGVAKNWFFYNEISHIAIRKDLTESKVIQEENPIKTRAYE